MCPAVHGPDPVAPPRPGLLRRHERLLRRSLLTALLVGTLLFLGNQGRRAVDGPYTAELWARLAFTFAVPFLVSLVSGVFTRRELEAERASSAGAPSPAASSPSGR